jgi:hypothetical protein
LPLGISPHRFYISLVYLSIKSDVARHWTRFMECILQLSKTITAPEIDRWILTHLFEKTAIQAQADG